MQLEKTHYGLIVGIILIAAGGVLFYQGPQATETTVEYPHADSLYKGTVIIKSDNFKGIMAWSMKAGDRIAGKFTVKGGNDIDFLILDDDAYDQWKNRETYDALFKALRSSGATFDVTIPEDGDYNMVFDNAGDDIKKYVEFEAIRHWTETGPGVVYDFTYMYAGAGAAGVGALVALGSGVILLVQKIRKKPEQE